jgi:hypothetical protein
LNSTALLIFTYNRPEHTQKVLDQLLQCRRLAECDVIIISDGLRKAEHEENVEATRKVIRKWVGLHPAEVIVRPINFGLKKNIETGVTEVLKKYPRVIVLEDDILVNLAFLEYQLQALDYYEHDERVLQVAGYTFPFDTHAPQGTMLLPLTTTYGWGTWARAWKFYNPDARDAARVLQDKKKAKLFDLNGNYPYTRLLMGVAEGKAQSWGVLFWFAVWNRDGLVVYPRQSMVMNIGFDGSGVNSGTDYEGWETPHFEEDYSNFKWEFVNKVDNVLFLDYCKFVGENTETPSQTVLSKIRTFAKKFFVL